MQEKGLTFCDILLHSKMPPNMVADPAFKNMSNNMTGFHVWRIENMLVVPIPNEAWGKFYCGDAYIILSSAPYGNRYIQINKTKLGRGIRLVGTYCF